ncbi:MAG: sigma-54-dependent Fis family transcriptional regulator, partial [Bacteroidales bacterium]|nr:sigma-54-dependent Fis family transcriptional regulator [Bacteroidales bacterium]
NMDLEALVREGRFREDLYYRINTVHLRLPSLKDRPDDILPLARLFLERFADKYHRPVAGLTEAAEDLLRAHDWSGNIRELQNSIEKAVILSDGETIGAGDLQFDTLRQPEGKGGADGPETLEMAEERMIREAMARFGGNLTAVAKALNISRPTLYKKLGKYNI